MCKKNRSLILLVQSHLYSAINILRWFQRKQMVHLIAKPPLKLRAGVDCGLTARSRRINHEGCCTRSGRKINGERCGFCKKVLIKPGDAAQMHCWWQNRVGMLAFWLKSTPSDTFSNVRNIGIVSIVIPSSSSFVAEEMADMCVLCETNLYDLSQCFTC